MFVTSFEEFKANAAEDTLNIMDTANLDGFDSGFFAEEVEKFVSSRPNVKFHIFYVENNTIDGTSGLNVGHIKGKKLNVTSYLPLPEINIKKRLENGIYTSKSAIVKFEYNLPDTGTNLSKQKSGSVYDFSGYASLYIFCQYFFFAVRSEIISILPLKKHPFQISNIRL